MTVTLPVPDAEGIYTFPDDLMHAHHQWTEHLSERHRAQDRQIIELRAPHSGHRYFIEMRRPAGRPVLAIEPHHDDFALSASGTFLGHPRPLTVATVFTRSTSVHPTLEDTYGTETVVSDLRSREGAAALAPLAADRILLGHKDAEPRTTPSTRTAWTGSRTNSARSSKPTPTPNSSPRPPSPATPTISSCTRQQYDSDAAGSGKTSGSGPPTPWPAATSTSSERVPATRSYPSWSTSPTSCSTRSRCCTCTALRCTLPGRCTGRSGTHGPRRPTS